MIGDCEAKGENGCVWEWGQDPDFAKPGLWGWVFEAYGDSLSGLSGAYDFACFAFNHAANLEHGQLGLEFGNG